MWSPSRSDVSRSMLRHAVMRRVLVTDEWPRRFLSKQVSKLRITAPSWLRSIVRIQRLVSRQGLS